MQHRCPYDIVLEQDADRAFKRIGFFEIQEQDFRESLSSFHGQATSLVVMVDGHIPSGLQVVDRRELAIT